MTRVALVLFLMLSVTLVVSASTTSSTKLSTTASTTKGTTTKETTSKLTKSTSPTKTTTASTTKKTSTKVTKSSSTSATSSTSTKIKNATKAVNSKTSVSPVSSSTSSLNQIVEGSKSNVSASETTSSYSNTLSKSSEMNDTDSNIEEKDESDTEEDESETNDLELQKKVKEMQEQLTQNSTYQNQKRNKTLSQTQKDKFKQWKLTNNKTYNRDEDDAAVKFTYNDERISKINSKKNKTFVVGHNKYSDKSFEENKKLRTGLKIPPPSEMEPTLRSGFVFNEVPLPTSVNYTKYMQPIKDQKDCGACYAFSALGLVEYMAKVNKKSLILSEQNIIDCDVFTYGCDGGWPTKALQFVRDFGVADGKKYKYANSRQLCLKKKYPPVMNVTKACENQLVGTNQQKENALKTLVAKHPVIVGFHVTIDFMYYKEGIFSDETCGDTIDHALVVVGYGTDKNTKQDYWIVRNSWGTSWGMKGYGLVARNGNNTCQIASWAMYICE